MQALAFGHFCRVVEAGHGHVRSCRSAPTTASAWRSVRCPAQGLSCRPKAAFPVYIPDGRGKCAGGAPKKNQGLRHILTYPCASKEIKAGGRREFRRRYGGAEPWEEGDLAMQASCENSSLVEIQKTPSVSLAGVFQRMRFIDLLRRPVILKEITLGHGRAEFRSCGWDDYWRSVPHGLEKRLENLRQGWAGYIQRSFHSLKIASHGCPTKT